LNLAKVTVVKTLLKIRRHKLCSGVAAYYVRSILVCTVMQCVAQSLSALHTACTPI